MIVRGIVRSQQHNNKEHYRIVTGFWFEKVAHQVADAARASSPNALLLRVEDLLSPAHNWLAVLLSWVVLDSVSKRYGWAGELIVVGGRNHKHLRHGTVGVDLDGQCRRRRGAGDVGRHGYQCHYFGSRLPIEAAEACIVELVQLHTLADEGHLHYQPHIPSARYEDTLDVFGVSLGLVFNANLRVPGANRVAGPFHALTVDPDLRTRAVPNARI